MSFNSKDSILLNNQLQNEELNIRFEDLGLYSASGSVVTVDLGESVGSVVSVLHLDNSGPTAILIAAASRVLTGQSLAITLGAAFAANDSLVIRYRPE